MSAPQLPAGTVIANKYSVVALLGFGGSSATYGAVGADGREVALKVFDPAIRQRADIMAAIEQTYAGTNALPADVAVPLLDAGYDAATGAPFSVSERIALPSLAQLVAQRPLSPDEVGMLLAYLARALDAAHARQLFHHALKPTNIFVGFSQGQGQGLRITDFGAGLPRAAVPTQEGYAIAAPWLAPEQVTGGVAGAGSDVFSTALVAFYALTGRCYWRSCQGAPDLNGWQRELQAPRTPPSARARELGAQLSTGFDGVLGASLAVDPGQRYRSVGEFAAALESLVASKGPETAATMAFPGVALGLGDYPPPPPPMAGHGQPPAMPAQAPAPAPAQAPSPPQPALQPAYPSEAANAGGASIAQPGQPSSPSVAQARRPTMELSQTRRPASSKLAPILVAVAAVVLVGGGVAAWIMMGRTSTPETVIVPLASASTPVAESAAPTTSAAEAPSPVPSADTTPPPAAGEEVALSCEPSCDEIKVDDQAIELDKPLRLAEGKHTVVASKAEFKTVTDTITVVAGQKLEKTWKLASSAKPATGGGGVPTQTVTKPKCTRFIKVNCQR